MIKKYFSKRMPIILKIIWLGVGFVACDLGDVQKKRPVDDNSVISQAKTVEVQEFSKLEGKPFNFDTAIPDLIAISDGVLYTALSTTNDLYSWKIDKGNNNTAWEKLDDFAGADAIADFNLNSGTRTIERLMPIKGGVVAAVSDNTSAAAGTADEELGIALFSGQEKKASRSFSFKARKGKEGFSTIELSLTKGPNNERVIYAINRLFGDGKEVSFVYWVNLDDFSSWNAQGFIATAPYSALEFVTSTPLPFLNNHIRAIAPLPDGRVAIAKPAGLLTIAKDSVGKTNTDHPKLEQATDADVLKTSHAGQWKTTALLAPTEIGAMRLVGNKYLVIGFVDDGSGNGGVKFADATMANFEFSTNLDLPKTKIRSIVVDGNDAFIVDETTIIRFRDKIFSVLLANDALKSDLAYIGTGIRTNPSDPEPVAFNEKTFKGGNLGEVPDDKTKFYNVAVFWNRLFITTDKGIYSVTRRNVTKTFEVPKPKTSGTN